jgi:hypothetical protein
VRGLAHFVGRETYAEYRARLDVRELLAHYDAENAYDWTNPDGTAEIMHSCLLDRVERHHTNGDATPSASANCDKKTYNCYSGYWAGDIFHLVMKLENKTSFENIVPVLGDFLGDKTIAVDDFRARLKEIFAAPSGVAYTTQLSGYGEQILRPWAFIHPYLATRGIDADTASKFQIGWSETDNRITIPHFWKGRLVGWQMRAVPEGPDWPATDPAIPKYKSCPGFPKSETLYAPPDGILRGEEAIVVESPFSVIKAGALGLQMPVVATFGAKVSRAQLDLLKTFTRLHVWMDNDSRSVAGRLAERTLVRELYRHVRLDVVKSDLDRDLGDCSSLDEIHRKLATAEPAVVALARHRKEMYNKET